MSSSSWKYYYYSNTTRWEITANNGGGQSSSRNAANGNSKALEGTTRANSMPAKKEPPKNKPVGKFHDLLMHGVKPWDPDANDFYEALTEPRRRIDAQQAQKGSKTDSPTGQNHINYNYLKWESTAIMAGGSSSRNSGESKSKDKAPKEATTVVKYESPKELPMSKKPWDSDADDFYGILLKTRREIVSCHNEDSGIEAWEDEGSAINPWEEQDSEMHAYQDEDSDY